MKSIVQRISCSWKAEYRSCNDIIFLPYTIVYENKADSLKVKKDYIRAQPEFLYQFERAK